ncbi:glutathione S-transferase family protein [Vreelandella profundi]|uniref:glutathione S-transferase family protein n=1 Tax=Vreelandella profundi TaxID=2852117 RepID=UPI001EF02D29|nr:glutathione S-transferase family protein [Halomonas profundi]
MILYGVPLSPFVRKVLFTLYELELEFEQRFLVPGDTSADFRALSPLGRIPAFQDGEFGISDSSAICHYLLSRYPSELLDTANPESVARAVQWDKYADEDVAPVLLAPLIERLVKPVRFGTPADEAVVQKAMREQIPPVFDHLEERLQTLGGEWLMGPTFSYADIALGAHMSSFLLSSLELDAARWPALSGWVERLQKRTAFQRLCDDAQRFNPKAV